MEKQPEKIISFVKPQNTALPFIIELAGITYPNSSYSIYRDNSSIYCLEYVIDGEGYINIRDKTYHVTSGDVYLLPAGITHKYYSSPNNPWTKVWINVYGRLCNELYSMYNSNGIIHFPDLEIKNLFDDAISICQQRNIPTELIFSDVSIIFHKIMSKIYFYNNKIVDTNSSPSFQAKNYIDAHISEKIEVLQLTNIVGLSQCQLNRIFRRDFRLSPYEYVLNCKIETAKSLITNTNLTIMEISEHLSFADSHYFSNIFKKKVGMTPSNFRSNKEKF